MRVLFTVSTFYPRKDGVQNVTEYLAKGLVEKGHKVSVITTLFDGMAENEEYCGISIHRVRVYTRFGLYFGEKKKYRNYVLSIANNYDVMVNVCTQNALTDLLYPVLNKISIRKILHVHGIYNSKWTKYDFISPKFFAYKIWRNIRWGIYYSSRSFRKYDEIIQLHEFDYGNVFFSKKYKRKSRILENTCETAFLKGPLQNPDHRDYAICVANYSDRKNQEYVLRAFYAANVPGLRLVFVGSKNNDYLNKLKALKKRFDVTYGYRDVSFLFQLDRAATVSLIENAAMYLMGSTWEAFSISIIEAMASAVPFISTDVGVARFMPGGIVVSRLDQMTYWIEKLWQNKKTAMDIGAAGRDYYLQNMTMESRINAFEGILNG